MDSSAHPVPTLDLTPRLQRPLSLFNPLDYLRLLYWVFYFPQALRWYVDTYGGGEIPLRQRGFRSGMEGLMAYEIQRRLLIQGVILVGALPLGVGWGLQRMIPFDWSTLFFGIAYGVFFGTLALLFLSTTIGIIILVALGITGGLALGVAYGSVEVWTLQVDSFFAFGLAGGISIGLATGLVTGLALASLGGVQGYMVLGTMLGAGLALVLGLFGSFQLTPLGGLVRMGTFFLGWVAAYIRLDAYGLGLLSVIGGAERFAIAAATRLPLPGLGQSVQRWLQRDWETGIHNLNQLSRYTLQAPMIIQGLNAYLHQLPDHQVVDRIAGLTQTPCDWNLVRLVSAPLSPWRQPPLRTGNSAQATAAGFWLLHDGSPAAASQAFAVVKDDSYGEEMHALASGLAMFEAAQDTAAIAAIETPDFPPAPLLRPVTWQAMQRFCNVISDTKTVVGSVSRTARAFASNRALGELKHILDYVEELPEAEQRLVEDIARQWRNALLDMAASVGDESIDQPVRNPYIVGDPVDGSLFVGREDILRQLEELWLMGRQMQSVVLYGHRRMGKTSILRNAAAVMGSGLRVIYVNMLRSASASTVSDVLMAITDEMAETLDIPAPPDRDLEQQPYRTFERYLKRVIGGLGDTETLILAIDEFEKIEALIEADKLSPDFIAYLRGLVQMSPKLGFAFAGLHTLEEMTADYFNPFFASVIPIRVGFLAPGAVRQLLANPDPEFPLDYMGEALARIYRLTAGQPYLAQLVGFQLVRRYNNQVFEQGRQRQRVFSVEDVAAVVEDAEFFNRGRYYFTGVWDQAGRDVPEQQPVLQALAPRAAGLTLADLKAQTGLDNETLQAALGLLCRHDVVELEGDSYRIIVELFRRWVVQLET